MKLKSLKYLFPWLKKYMPLFIVTFVIAVFSAVCKLAIPFIAGLVINNLGPSTLDVILLVSCLVLGSLCRRLYEYFIALLGQKVVRDMRKDVYASFLGTSIKQIDSSRKGDLVQRLINDIENINTGLITGIATLFDGVVTIAVTVIFMFTLNWLLAIVAVVLIPMSLLVSRFVSKFNSKHFKAQAKASGLVSAFTSESLTNSTSVETLGIGERRNKEFDVLNEEFRKNTFNALIGASLINPSTRLINAIINAVLIMLGAVIMIKGSEWGMAFKVGSLTAFLTYASTFMQPFNDVSNVMSELGYATSSLERVYEAIQFPKDINEGKQTIDKTIETLGAKGINFSYDGKRTIIKDFNLDIKKGQKVAFVGPSGCGKTTIINILMRFYDPQEGEFSINGVSTKDIAKKSLREHVGMVLQETWIFSGTVFENIAYAKPNATLEEVKEAARKAQADRFIERLPRGYETRISDSSGLSVGEKQLICVARVMLLEPEIVILDEATSNIDIRTEKLLNESFKHLFEGRTSLVVAHRLSTIVSSDIIVCLKDGAIMEAGSHKELLEKKGFYYNLFNAQFK